MPRVFAFVAAFLLFAAQPLAGKWLLPDFGGAPAVWIACLLAFQLAVLAGYAAVRQLVRLAPRTRRRVLYVLTGGAFGLLLGGGRPPRFDLGMPAVEAVLALTLWTLPAAVLLACVSPLLQHLRRSHGDRDPYRLSAWSNVGSLAGLLSYPVLIEPWLSRSLQTLLFALGVAAIGLVLAVMTRMPALPPVALGQRGPLRWWVLPALGTVLLAGHTNVLCQDIAPIPLLWVVPLACYLLTWIAPFAHPCGYHRGTAVGVALAAIAAGIWLRQDGETSVVLLAVVELITLTAGCWCCHGEVALLRPAAIDLDRFWRTTAIGGVIGTVLVTLVAPVVLVGYHEQRIALAVVLVAAAMAPRLNATRHAWRYALATVVVIALALPAQRLSGVIDGTLHIERTFFGVLAVRERGTGADARRVLYHGATLHGVQMQDGREPPLPAAYYGETSGLGEVFAQRSTSAPLRVGAVGLGVGTLATWLRPGDHATVVEIDPAVTRLAERYFTFLAASPGTVAIYHGDGRLHLDALDGSYDILILDAFSDGAVPAHLLTREAFAVWQRLLAPGGICCVHISNRHLDLAPITRAAAETVGWRHLVIEDAPSDAQRPRCTDSIWFLAGTDAAELNAPALRQRSSIDNGERRLWTDERSDLWGSRRR